MEPIHRVRCVPYILFICRPHFFCSLCGFHHMLGTVGSSTVSRERTLLDVRSYYAVQAQRQRLAETVKTAKVDILSLWEKRQGLSSEKEKAVDSVVEGPPESLLHSHGTPQVQPHCTEPSPNCHPPSSTTAMGAKATSHPPSGEVARHSLSTAMVAAEEMTYQAPATGDLSWSAAGNSLSEESRGGDPHSSGNGGSPTFPTQQGRPLGVTPGLAGKEDEEGEGGLTGMVSSPPPRRMSGGRRNLLEGSTPEVRAQYRKRPPMEGSASHPYELPPIQQVGSPPVRQSGFSTQPAPPPGLARSSLVGHRTPASILAATEKTLQRPRGGACVSQSPPPLRSGSKPLEQEHSPVRRAVVPGRLEGRSSEVALSGTLVSRAMDTSFISPSRKVLLEEMLGLSIPSSSPPTTDPPQGGVHTRSPPLQFRATMSETDLPAADLPQAQHSPLFPASKGHHLRRSLHHYHPPQGGDSEDMDLLEPRFPAEVTKPHAQGVVEVGVSPPVAKSENLLQEQYRRLEMMGMEHQRHQREMQRRRTFSRSPGL